jgi:hypothetical protein
MSAWFPFLSLRSHRETIAAKDETIALLRETVKQLTDSLEAFREASLHLRTPQPRPQRPAQEKEPSAPAINYAAIDPGDTAALLQAARSEMGPGKVSAPQLMRRVDQIRTQIVASRKAQELKAFTSVNLAAPEDIEQQIAQAIAEGQNAAGVNS